MRGLVVVMWLLLMGNVVLQISTGEGGAAPGPLTSTATSDPTGAKAWTRGCSLTAVITSDCCTRLVGVKDTNRVGKGKGNVGQ